MSLDSLLPQEDQMNRRTLKQPALNSSLMDRILESSNVRSAWKHVKSNRGKPGVDNLSIADFLEYSRVHWSEIRESLEGGMYKPSPVLRVEIPKKSGGKRPLGIPTVCDRVIQQSILQVLHPIFDSTFSESSFGFRPHRSAHEALDKVRELAESGLEWVVDIDIEKFFDTVNHDILMRLISEEISDKTLLKLIGRYLRAGVSEKGDVHKSLIGTPQGVPLSPLLANIYLDVLDKELEKRGLHFVRYADDLLILVGSRIAAERVMASVTKFIERKLKLVVNRKKSAIRKIDDVKYLGFNFTGQGKLKLRWNDEALADFKFNIKKMTGRSWFVSMKYRLMKLSRYIRGWMQYYGRSQYYKPIPELGSWIRRRVRMCYLKQWRFKRTRMNRYIAFGVSFRTAKRSVFIDKGWWYLSGILASQNAMTNKWLSEQGLLSIKDIWVKIHYPVNPKLQFASVK